MTAGRQRSRGAARLAGALAVLALTSTAVPVIAQTKSDPIQQTLNDAASALQKGLLDQAVQFYTDALADKALSNDRRAIAHADRGAVHMRRQAYKLAIEDFNRSVQLSPEYAPAYNNRGNALIAVGALKEAIKDFDRALVLSPSYGAAFANRASAHFRAGALDQALADYSRAIELAPHTVSALNGRGLVHLAAERAHAATRDFSRAVALDLRFAAGYRNRAAAMAVLARPEDAIEDLSRAIAFDAKSIDIHLSRADAYLGSGNVAGALADYNRVIELAPKSAAGFVGRAMAHARSDRSDDALNDLAKAIELNPKDPRAYAVRAWVYKLLAQLDLAQKDMERALKLEPLTADALWAQGELEDARGRNDAAVQAFTKALGIDQRHKPTLDALNRLGLVASREEIEVTGAGTDGWKVLQSGDHYTAINAQFPNLKVPLDMFGKGVPKIAAFERQKAPYSTIGVLRFAAGRLELPGRGPEDLEAAAIIDLQSQSVVGLTLNKKASKSATWEWEEGRVLVTAADGILDDIALKGIKGPAVASLPQGDRGQGRRDGGPGQRQSGSGGTPAWAPWAQPGGSPPSRQTAQNRQKPKSLFEMLFGN